MAIPDVTATLSVQGVSSETDILDAERFWINGILFGDNIAVGTYNDSSNLTDSADDDPVVLRNVKWINANQAEVDTVNLSSYGPAKYGLDTFGGTLDVSHPVIVNLPLPTDVCQFHINVTSDVPVSVTSAKFYAYDGINDTTPFRGITFYAVEGGTTPTWVAANGQTQALVCSNQSSALSHDWFVAVTASPTMTGDLQGKIKFVYTYS